MLRWVATVAILLLFALNAALPYTSIGRRGNEAVARADIETSIASVGQALPANALAGLVDLDGRPFELADLRGHRVLLTFERSVDW
jgi:cytochrome oxidase Cu insertion factor (SCO1/SenC/PrrC family)